MQKSKPIRLDRESTLKRIETLSQLSYTESSVTVTQEIGAFGGEVLSGRMRRAHNYGKGTTISMQQGDIAYSPSDRSRQIVARLLERAIAPDLLPVTIQVGEQEVDTAQYIAELADIARNPGALTATNDDHRWSTPH